MRDDTRRCCSRLVLFLLTSSLPSPFEAWRWGKKTDVSHSASLLRTPPECACLSVSVRLEAFASVSLQEFPVLRWSIPPLECSLRKVFSPFLLRFFRLQSGHVHTCDWVFYLHPFAFILPTQERLTMAQTGTPGH